MSFPLNKWWVSIPLGFESAKSPAPEVLIRYGAPFWLWPRSSTYGSFPKCDDPNIILYSQVFCIMVNDIHLYHLSHVINMILVNDDLEMSNTSIFGFPWSTPLVPCTHMYPKSFIWYALFHGKSMDLFSDMVGKITILMNKTIKHATYKWMIWRQPHELGNLQRWPSIPTKALGSGGSDRFSCSMAPDKHQRLQSWFEMRFWVKEMLNHVYRCLNSFNVDI